MTRQKSINKIQLLCNIEQLINNKPNFIINLSNNKKIEIYWVSDHTLDFAFSNFRDNNGGSVVIFETFKGFINPLQFNDNELLEIYDVLKRRNDHETKNTKTI